MSKFITFKPIGEILQEAGLINTPQLELALRDQTYYEDMRLGEILTSRGWIKQETADFFVQEWFRLINNKIEHPIGFYFQKAGLLSEDDVNKILVEQHQLSLRFGEMAIKQDLLKHHTVNFFLQNLFPSQLNLKNNLKRSQSQINIDTATQKDITYWIGLGSDKITNSQLT